MESKVHECRSLKLAIVLFGVVLLHACGQANVANEGVADNSAEFEEVAADSAVIEEEVPVTDPTIEQLLVGTEWEVVEMTGFPADNIVEGTIEFSTDSLIFDDGAGTGTGSIVWNDTGFSVGPIELPLFGRGPRYLRELFGLEDSTTMASLDEQTLTLTRADFTVIAELRSAADAPATEPTIEDLLVGTEWNVVEMTGFPPNNVLGGSITFAFPGFVGFDDGVNTGGGAIIWTESGFVVEEIEMTAIGGAENMPFLRRIFGLADSAVTASVEGQTLTLTREDLTVIAQLQSPVDAPVEQPAIEELLIGTRWDVVDMVGFPSDTIVVGWFNFRRDVFFFEDGCNGGGASIAWTDGGFVVTDPLTTTDVECPPGHRLSQLFGPSGVSIDASLEGQTLTLSGDGLTVIAESR